ncbi:hypothetical protein ACIQUL_35890 [Streptomyces sp. NPDC090303]|uniref:hypothetical protein n=1 Tax=Streptomyces sp. NPDC090303 TaxID=3365960 RepID=UPI003830528A
MRTAFERVRGMMQESDGKVLRNDSLREEGRRRRTEAREEASRHRGDEDRHR